MPDTAGIDDTTLRGVPLAPVTGMAKGPDPDIPAPAEPVRHGQALR